MIPVVLASSSPYRRDLLERLRIDFETASPDLDERALPGETPQALVQRLARGKASALATRFPHHLIIGSDQVAVCDGEVLTKPGTPERARAQLQRQSGQDVDFLTSLCVLNSASGRQHTDVALTRVRFRPLGDDEIARYIARENPIDCAGSFKCESLGISLFAAIDSDDPTALIGLPLIRLCGMLRTEGIKIP